MKKSTLFKLLLVFIMYSVSASGMAREIILKKPYWRKTSFEVACELSAASYRREQALKAEKIWLKANKDKLYAKRPFYSKKPPAYIFDHRKMHRGSKNRPRLMVRLVDVRFHNKIKIGFYQKFISYLNKLIHENDRRILMACLKKSDQKSIIYQINIKTPIERFQFFLDRANIYFKDKI